MKIITLQVGALGTNSYIVYDENGVGAVIDPGDDAGGILDTARKNGVEITHILLTHGHCDHASGANQIKNKTGAKIVAHKAEVRCLADSAINLSSTFMCGGMPPVHADLLVSDGDVIACGSMKFSVLHTPGHTTGSCCYIVDDNIFSGDTLFYREIGRVDFPTGSMESMEKSLRKLKRIEGEFMVYPGHEQKTALSEEKRSNPYMMRL